MNILPNQIGLHIEVPPGMQIRVEPLLVPVGVVPAMGASAVALPPELQSDAERNGAVHRLEATPEAQSKGEQIIQMVRDAVRACQSGGTRPPVNALRQLARLIEVRPEFAYRVPELSEYLGWLADKKEDALLRRIAGDARPGRPRENYMFLVTLIDRIVKLHGCSVAKAAAIAAKRYGAFLCMGTEAIRNRYSELRELYHAVNGVQYADGKGLLPYPLSNL